MKNKIATKRHVFYFVGIINFIAIAFYIWELHNDSKKYAENFMPKQQQQHLLIIVDTLSIHYYYFNNLNIIYFDTKPTDVFIFGGNSGDCMLSRQSIETNRVDLKHFLDKTDKYRNLNRL